MVITLDAIEDDRHSDTPTTDVEGSGTVNPRDAARAGHECDETCSLCLVCHQGGRDICGLACPHAEEY